ncbi:ATP-binding protein [Nonomuraea harbinensis]|uniref:Biotin carboxylase N-terminal domain-containing protein n=1 Tax=Nonomuraea harbinensis TaxID=1286938 RepID=A0ABW1C3I0_9ACTN|nr:biotin carboxylase N-terminal domain-containing protein [Nonomuraea harbinensis]
MIRRLLVANRGEIARRVFRTCRELGVETVALYSDADADAPHVAEADLAVRLSGVKPAGTYLAIDRVIEACRVSGADAVHPGYGFLSENAAFARAVLDAGLTWVGPPPDAIAAMGSKTGAKRLMAEAGVPVLPTLDPAAPGEFPVLVKASAGGGGRGMRVVRDPADLARQVESARREAEAAFGDGGVFVEPLLERARHVEVQVLADGHGTVWALGERECSVQRRHQKVVEECPSPAVTPELRARLADAAVRAARAIGYTGAGTVEFLVAGERVAFLEVNTRLQVEHPVTELVYGVDLVRLQLEVAEGARLPEAPPEPRGHAVEARLYAEDLAYLPQSGVLHRFEVAGAVRVDAGVESGSVVSPHYDPMLAKIVGYGATRGEAVRKLASALRGARLHGVTTNRDMLLQILKNPAFERGDTHTGFLDEHPPAPPPPPGAREALAAALAMARAGRDRAPVLRSLPSGWRNVRSQPRTARFEETEATYDPLPPGTVVVAVTPLPAVRTGSDGGAYRVVLETDGVRRAFEVCWYGDGKVYADGPEGAAVLTPVPRLPEPVEHVAPGSLLAPMPGSVLRVEVEPGDRVAKGTPILVLEAMKMEHAVTAPAAGVVATVHVEKGRQVDAGAVLAVIRESDDDGAGAQRP